MKRLLVLALAVSALSMPAAANATQRHTESGFHHGTVFHSSAYTGPAVKPPAGVPTARVAGHAAYYATRPPGGRYVQVFDPALNYLVWVSLPDAQAHGWYARGGRIAVGWILLIIAGSIALTLGASAWLTRGI